MGKIFNIGQKIVSSKLFKAVDFTYTAAILHPLESIKAAVSPTKTISEVVAKSHAQPLKKEVAQIATSAVNIGLTLLGGSAIIGAAKAGTLGVKAAAIGKSLIPKTIGGKVAAAVVAPVALSAVISNPLKAVDVAASTQAGLVNIGTNIGELAANPSLSNLKNLITENPIIVGAAAAAGLALGAKTLLPALVTSKQINATQEQTAAIESATKSLGSGRMSVLPYTPSIPMENETKASKVPLTPATQVVGATSTRRRKRSVAKAKTPSITQKVNVLIGNRNTKLLNKGRLSLGYGAN